MRTFLLRASRWDASKAHSPHPIFACVAGGSANAAQGLVLGELHRAGWKVLEILEPDCVRREFPGLNRHPAIAHTMAAARQQGLAFLVLESESTVL